MTERGIERSARMLTVERDAIHGLDRY